MQILAIDTATPTPSVTLLTAGGAVWEEPLSASRGLISSGGLIPPPQPSPRESRRASEELLPAIERCFTAAGTHLPDCDRIAVCSGPGSFTGLRIGLAIAWGLGRAAGIPVETVSTLEALAETARYQELSGGQASKRPAPPSSFTSRGQVPKGPAAASLFTSRGQAPKGPAAASLFRVATVLDAGRGEVVLAVYSLETDRARLVAEPERLPIEAARERAARLHTVALPPDLLEPAGAARAAISPSRALALAVARRPGQTLSRLEGIYSRPSAAEEKRGAP
jgi:tRNA threonylcarbamoyl adenosine modification protein YeaZ